MTFDNSQFHFSFSLFQSFKKKLKLLNRYFDLQTIPKPFKRRAKTMIQEACIQENKQTKTEQNNGDRSYNEKMGAK